MKNLILILSFLFLQLAAIGQGVVRGTVTDGSNGEAIMFGNVLVEETSTGTTTDLDGNFTIELAVGSYTLVCSYLGYAETKITEVVITDGETTVLNVELGENANELAEVVVTSTQLRTTEGALNTLKVKSPVVLDGISKQSFKKIGDSDAAGAITRVTGVSVQGGKYVFVRGLGDRYTKTILNGMDIPGLDPDRNSLQMDIFPTNLIDNILVMKSFNPDLPGDFTGGVVNIETKEFPEQKTMTTSIGFGYNPTMHFNPESLGYTGSATDALGFDNGQRNLPLSKESWVPTPANNNNALTGITQSFGSELAAKKVTSTPNINFAFSGGNQYELGAIKLGINGALNYRNNSTYFSNVAFNSFIKADDNGVFELDIDKKQQGQLASNNVLLSGLFGTSVKTGNHKFSLNLIGIQNGESTTGDFTQESIIENSAVIVRDNLEYSQRSIYNVLLKGEHALLDNRFKIDWKLAPTFSNIADKDIRVTPFRLDDGVYSIEPSEGAEPQRLWRDLNEVNYTGKVDFENKIQLAKSETKIKYGVSNTFKARDYEILAYTLGVKGQSYLNIGGDPDALLAPENLWTTETGVGSYYTGNFEPSNAYSATQNILSGYVMNDLKITPKLRAIYGVRVESFNHFYTGQDQQGTIYDNQKILESVDVLPSLNLVYSLQERMNLRLSGSRTLARPSFKEASGAQIYDALSDRTFIGNTELVVTDITNFDFRWEWYQNRGQMFSVSTFYKAFVNPIELVAYKQQTPNDFQPRNVGDATVLGVEIEFRKDLDFITEKLSGFAIGSNVTLVQSSVELDRSQGGEYDSKVANARTGETVEETRAMQGQSPYIINAFLNYSGAENNTWGASLNYNVQGPSLFIVGIGSNPDVFQSPFNSLNFKLTKSLGEENKLRLGVKVSNILGATQEKVYTSYGAEDQLFEFFDPARTFSFSLGYNIF